MRVRLICPECAKSTGGVGIWFVETIREDGLYTGKCPKGHVLLVGTQTLPHEMLFEIALNAISDGYYREAVSSFAASMERYFEFAIRVIAKKHKVSSEVFGDAWKLISKQSERQLGSYIFLYLLDFGTLPALLSDKMIALRNDVIHKGKLPERREALAYGEDVYKVIQESVGPLRTTHLDQVNIVVGERVAGIAGRMGDIYPRTFQVTSTALNIIENIASGYRSFEQICCELGISFQR